MIIIKTGTVYYFIGPEAALTKKDFRNLDLLKAFKPKFLKNLIYGFPSLNNAINLVVAFLDFFSVVTKIHDVFYNLV